MSWPAVRAAIKVRMDAITGIENVHTYKRHDNAGFDSFTFRSLFTVDESGLDGLNGWTISRKSVNQAQCPDSDSTVKRTHSVEIDGFYRLEDSSASENVFNALIDLVLTDLNTGDRSFGSACLTHSLPQATRIQQSLFYGILANTTTITLEVEENV